MIENTDISAIIAKFSRALQVFTENDLHLLIHNANERTVTHKLAEYLQDQFSEYNVDCEYNRNGHEPKRVRLDDAYDEPEGKKYKSIYPDIIVHRRGTNEHNLLIVEAKKSTDSRGAARELFDKKKLVAYATSEELHYPVGIYIFFYTGKRATSKPHHYVAYYDNQWHECGQ
jgi:hypothetical protein